MYKDKVINGILEKIAGFNENIAVPCGYGSIIWDEIITKAPKLLFFIQEMNLKKSESSVFGGTENLQLVYHNRDIDIGDVFYLTEKAEVLSRLHSYVGNYKTKIGIVTDFSFDVGSVFNEFSKKYGAFFSNFASYEMSGSACGNKAIYIIRFKYRIGHVKLNMMEIEVKKEIERVCKLLFDSDMPAEAKAYLAHNYLATSVVYYGADSTSNLEKSYVHSAYGALITKKCVCQGIAEAFKRLMDQSGVYCEVVCGQIIGHEDYHAWNVVKASNGDCFHIDTTWDISPDLPSFAYFGRNDAFLGKTRQWNKRFTTECRPKSNIFMLAKMYVTAHKTELLEKGIPQKVLCV